MSLSVLLGLVAACGPAAPTPNPTPTATVATATPVAVATASQPTPGAEVETGAAAAGASAQFVDTSGTPSYSGEIVARSSVNVVAEVGGEVMAVEVAVGEQVKAG
ncbi:MAG TPA: hypothetical protein PKE45_00510, partial [Caldilineaceae bacterium]|nr:hypothetical protein [Caldilineaceae bacterium]